MRMNGCRFIKIAFILMMAAVLTLSYAVVVFASPEGGISTGNALDETSILPEEAEFEDEEVPLASVPDAEDDPAVVTPFNIISAVGSYSLLIPALLLAFITLLVAVFLRKKDKAAAANNN